MSDAAAVAERLYEKLKVLNERLWEQRVPRPVIDAWLANFEDDIDATPSEKLHGLYLLSQFIYFGDREVRELLKALYRDHFRYRVVESLRRAAGDTLDVGDIEQGYEAELRASRFLGVGNPSESGTHLLYYFRQENALPKDIFVDLTGLFDRRLDDPDVDLADAGIRRIIFVDDLCGSGSQAATYSSRVLSVLRSIEQRRGIELHISYLVLVARTDALATIEASTEFDEAHAVLELDDTHKSVSTGSRHFQDPPSGVNLGDARQLAESYGITLWSAHPLGWRDGQLLLGFHHNVPDNTLPILWWDGPESQWTPVFRRYPKVYG